MGIHNYPVYEATKECARCKGECCKRMPGHYSPSDFKDLSFEGLKAEIEKGSIAIDWWENKTPEYFLRARHLGENVVHGSWGGICVHLTPSGCRLPWEERPLACRNLKPSKHECVGTYSKEQCKNDWKPYDEVLCKLVEHFSRNEENPEEIADRMVAAIRALVGGKDV